MSMWVEMRKHFAARQMEWFSAVAMFMWGSLLVLMPSLFNGPVGISFRGMLALAPQPVWALTTCMAGGTRLVALFINGKWGVTPLIRVLTSFIAVFFWFMIIVGVYLSRVMVPALVLYSCLMISDMISAFRAASDAYEAEANKRLLHRAREPIASSETSNVTALRGN